MNLRNRGEFCVEGCEWKGLGVHVGGHFRMAPDPEKLSFVMGRNDYL